MAEKAELRDRWKRAGALKSIGRTFGEPSSSVNHQLTPHEGIETPAEMINAGVASIGGDRHSIADIGMVES